MIDLLNLWGEDEPSELSRAAETRRQNGLLVEDFVTANPFDYGFRFNEDLLQGIMANAMQVAQRYGATAFGRPGARIAVAQFHSQNNINQNSANDPAQLADRVVITPATSLAYFYLFRLLADSPRSNILCPSPTYPLFDDLASVAGINVRRYHLTKLKNAGGMTRWMIDPDELAFQITPETRAIVVVSPHNPTGTVTSKEEMIAICEIVNRSGILLIHDEVFREYATNPRLTPVVRPADYGAEFSAVLNGLSKSHFLPGLKAGWIVFDGIGFKSAEKMKSAIAWLNIKRFMSALEHLADTFLPVSDPVQATFPGLLSQEGLSEMKRLATLQRSRLLDRLAWASNQGIPVDQPEAGPYICFSAENNAEAILKQTGALFHPGNLYGMPPKYLVSTIFNPASWPVQFLKA